MHLSLTFVTSLILPLSTALAGVVRDLTTASLTVHLVAPCLVHKADDLVVATTVVNDGPRDIAFLEYGVMKQQLDNFAVIDASGNPVKFTGVHVTFNAESAVQNGGDLIVLPPGANVTVTHPLAKTYDLAALTRGDSNGVFLSTLGRTFYIVDQETGSVVPVQADAFPEQITFAVAPNADLAVSESAGALNARAPETGCTVLQDGVINNAIPYAIAYITAATTYMDALEQGAADPSVYQRWFGLTDAGRVQKVASAFRNMDNNTLLGFTFNCGTAAPLCVPGVGAYVSPLQLGIVQVCDSFFGWPVVGSFSQASALVHETSHFTANGGTIDVFNATTETGALQLAIDSPADAVTNAYNYQFFSFEVL